MNKTSIEYFIPEITLKNNDGVLSLADTCIINNNLSISEIRTYLSSVDTLKGKLSFLGERFSFEKDIGEKRYPAADLFLEFSDLSSDADIESFVSKNGFLGLHINKLKEKLMNIPVLLSVRTKYFLSGYTETIEELKCEARKIKQIVIAFGNTEKLVDDYEIEDIENLIDNAEKNIEIIIKEIPIKVSWKGDKLSIDWLPETLLELMYVQIVKSFSSHLLPQICPECGRSFIPKREGTIYCQYEENGKTCKDRAKQRRFIERRRIKNKHSSSE